MAINPNKLDVSKLVAEKKAFNAVFRVLLFCALMYDPHYGVRFSVLHRLSSQIVSFCFAFVNLAYPRMFLDFSVLS